MAGFNKMHVDRLPHTNEVRVVMPYETAQELLEHLGNIPGTDPHARVTHDLYWTLRTQVERKLPPQPKAVWPDIHCT